MLLKRYMLIFTLALISCVGTNYIQSLSTDNEMSKANTEYEKVKENKAIKSMMSEKKVDVLATLD